MPGSRPIGRAAGTGVTTAGVAVAVPNGASRAEIRVTADSYVGLGHVVSPIPAATTANTAYAFTAANPRVIDLERYRPESHVYIYAVAATIDYTISFLG